MTISPKLLTPENHVTVMLDMQGQMAFAIKNFNICELQNNIGIVAGATKIFEVPTIVTTIAEETFSGPVLRELEESYPKSAITYYERTTMNCWEDDAVYQAIISPGKKKVVFAGFWTSVCIIDPALCAIEEGYEVYAITDACGDVSIEAHERALQRLLQGGVQLITSVQYLLELQRDWSRTKTYTDVTDLIKRYGGTYGIGIDYAHKMLSH